MKLHEIMAHHGQEIFRLRSYIPLLFIAPLIFAFNEAAHMESLMGDAFEDLWVLFSFIISIAGLAIRWFTVGFVPAGTSGRNTTDQRAERLNTTGLYSIVRNPLYLGNYIILLGVLLSFRRSAFVKSLVACTNSIFGIFYIHGTHYYDRGKFPNKKIR